MKREEKYNPDDLLKPANMIRIYAQGAFPMADDDGDIHWYFPESRTLILLNNFNVPRSLRQFMDKSGFEYRYDYDPITVIRNCANRERTWISEKLIKAYEGLEKLGHLHSVEVYQNENLVGGLYGISFKGMFIGESMFSKVSQASKSALVKLLERLKENGFEFLDIQFQTEHLKMFGSIEISLEEFHDILLKAYTRDVKF